MLERSYEIVLKVVSIFVVLIKVWFGGEESMTKQEYLLTVASEECAEIQQAISKSLRFGLRATHPDAPMITNELQILREFHQLEAMMWMLIEEGILTQPDFNERAAIMDNKEAKVRRYMEISRELGRLTDEIGV